MADTYTASLRLTKPEVNANLDVWEALVNAGMVQLAEDAIAGRQDVSVTAGNVVLTENNGATDQARYMFLRATGTPGVSRNIEVPTLDKIYIIQNDSDASVVIKTNLGGGVTFTAGTKAMVYVSASADDVFAITSGSPVLQPNTTAAITLDIVGATGGDTTVPAFWTVQGNVVYLNIQEFASTGFAALTLLELEPTGGGNWPDDIVMPLLSAGQFGNTALINEDPGGGFVAFNALILPPVGATPSSAAIRFVKNVSPFSWTAASARTLTHSLTMVYHKGTRA